MSIAGFLFDEHIPPGLGQRLVLVEPRIAAYRVGQLDELPKGTPDTVLLTWIEAHDCLLVTNNRSSMPVHLPLHLAAGSHIPGILQTPRVLHIGRVLNDLLLIWGAGAPDEFRDRITYLPLR